MVRADADIDAGMPLGAALTNDDVAGDDASRRRTSSRRGAWIQNRDRCATNRQLSCVPSVFSFVASSLTLFPPWRQLLCRPWRAAACRRSVPWPARPIRRARCGRRACRSASSLAMSSALSCGDRRQRAVAGRFELLLQHRADAPDQRDVVGVVALRRLGSGSGLRLGGLGLAFGAASAWRFGAASALASAFGGFGLRRRVGLGGGLLRRLGAVRSGSRRSAPSSSAGGGRACGANSGGGAS